MTTAAVSSATSVTVTRYKVGLLALRGEGGQDGGGQHATGLGGVEAAGVDLLGGSVHQAVGGRLARAEHGLAEVVAERRAAGEGFMAMLVGYDLGQVQRAQGRLGAALASYQRWLEPAGQAGRLPPHAGVSVVPSRSYSSRATATNSRPV